MLTALMMIAPLHGKSNTILFPDGTVSRPFLNISSEMIKDFSGDDDFACEIEEEKLNIRAQYKRTKDFVYKVEPDATAASYFLTLPQIVGGSCELHGIWDKCFKEIVDIPRSYEPWVLRLAREQRADFKP